MTTPNTPTGYAKILTFTKYQKFVIAGLTFLQFTLILDFMIISPLGAMIMPILKISTSQFGVVVSVYAFSAGISGFLAAGFADKYDRKKLLLFFYSGFVIGTFFCGIAPSYNFLLMARIMTGLFGGVIGSIVMAIATDLFPLEVRGRVIGFIQTGFAASQVLGLPIGLFISNLWGWHMPFLFIAILGLMVIFLINTYLNPIDEHLKVRIDRSPFHHLWTTLSTRRYLFALTSTALLSIGGFLLMPFGSAFTVHNLGIAFDQLPFIYFITGISTIFTGPMIGRFSDRFGKYEVFLFGSATTICMALIYTNLGVTPLPLVLLINTIMFVGIFSRMIPTQALMSAIPEPTSRGAFMSISSSIQQLAGGIASSFAGLIISQAADGHLEHFNRLGYILVGTVMISVVMLYFINQMVNQSLQPQQSG